EAGAIAVARPLRQFEDRLVIAQRLLIAADRAIRLGAEEAVQSIQPAAGMLQFQPFQQLARLLDLAAFELLLSDAHEGAARAGIGDGAGELLAAERARQAVRLRGADEIAGLGE